MTQSMELILIDQDGTPEKSLELSELAKQVAVANVENYKRNGFQAPWCAYFARVDDVVVGTCAFKAPPQNGQVEIAYFTFPEFEGRGFATQMAKTLIEIAKKTDPSVRLTAQTLPEKNASTTILGKLNFTNRGVVHSPEDGKVWEWELGGGRS